MSVVEKLLWDDLPQYQSHKIVRAAPIQAFEIDEHRINAKVWLKEIDGFFTISAGTFARYVPMPGDYLVVYDDGYVSVSPRKAFEEGYVRKE